MEPDTTELVAIATAIAGKCQPCFAYHCRQAQELGIPDDQIRDAIPMAKDIRASGDKHADEFAERRIKSCEESHA